MSLNEQDPWSRFQRYFFDYPDLQLSLDISRMNFSEFYFSEMEDSLKRAFSEMEELESGSLANPDENRMVGHYWLRNSRLAPDKTIQNEIDQVLTKIKDFHSVISNSKYKHYLLIGIGGSALGPQFVAQALASVETDLLKPHFFDNTDPDGMDQVLANLKDSLNETLCIVISKSGGTKETRNGMLEAKAAFKAAGLDFSKQAVAVTGIGSALHEIAKKEGWLEVFPMWDWVGGRTSEMSAVGLLPACLQGIQIDEMLRGARTCDELTRIHSNSNPAALLALMWYYAGEGQGKKDMVILPYKDRLELFSKYLQQLIMESLGKEKDLKGNIVNQGIAVYGNKGSTDQHAYVQQLREGVLNFFATFIEVLKDRSGESLEVEPGVTSGDFLHGFYLGTREALYEKGRESITITIEEISPFIIGVLIALYERAVGLYASLIEVNAYHQPGVEAGKQAAESIIDLKKRIIDFLKSQIGRHMSLDEISQGLQEEGKEKIFKICKHLAANNDNSTSERKGKNPLDSKFGILD